MKNRLMLIGVLACAGIFCAGGEGLSQTQTKKAPAASAATAPTKGDCLNCHGPFDKLIEASGKYVAPSGETGSPHRYVPHDSKKDEDIPECTHCHTAHPLDPLPAEGSIDRSKVNVQWCYDSCHHEKNFKSCKECHQ